MLKLHLAPSARLLLAAMAIADLPACATHHHHDRDARAEYDVHGPATRGRVYNSESGRYEWSTPGRAPVSPGATETSRSPYR